MEKQAKKVSPKESSKRVVRTTIKVKIYNTTGTLKITDLMFQGGSVATPWVGHPSEVKWSYDTI